VCFALRRAAPIIEQKFAEARLLNLLQKLLGDDLVGVYVRPIKRHDLAPMFPKWLHSLFFSVALLCETLCSLWLGFKIFTTENTVFHRAKPQRTITRREISSYECR